MSFLVRVPMQMFRKVILTRASMFPLEESCHWTMRSQRDHYLTKSARNPPCQDDTSFGEGRAKVSIDLIEADTAQITSIIDRAENTPINGLVQLRVNNDDEGRHRTLGY